MSPPDIDISTLPELEQAVGVFGSLAEKIPVFCDDSIIILMVYLYEVMY